MPGTDITTLMTGLARLALEAGEAILRHADASAVLKPDGSPVTAADAAAEAVILAGLARLCPALPVVAEEDSATNGLRAAAATFLLVDPLDGTRDFLNRLPEYTVNIALIEQGAPVAGVVYAPALGCLWLGGPAGAAMADLSPAPSFDAAHLRPIRCRPAPTAGLAALVSRSHNTPQTVAELACWPVIERKVAGSSLKFCQIAQGEGDLYPRLGPTMEWDTAAGDAVLRAAGGLTVTLAGAPLTYGRHADGYRNPHFIAFGDPALVPALHRRNAGPHAADH